MFQLKEASAKLTVFCGICLLLSSCGQERPRLSVSPPADLLQHPAEPEMTEEALTSEEAYERQRDSKIEWGRNNADIIDRACRWLKQAGVSLTCN